MVSDICVLLVSFTGTNTTSTRAQANLPAAAKQTYLPLLNKLTCRCSFTCRCFATPTYLSVFETRTYLSVFATRTYLSLPGDTNLPAGALGQAGGGKRPLEEEQLFFLSFAQTWCGVERKQAEETQLFDSHAPRRWRVMGTLSNSDGFMKAFQCPAGSVMNRGPDRCQLW